MKPNGDIVQRQSGFVSFSGAFFCCCWQMERVELTTASPSTVRETCAHRQQPLLQPQAEIRQIWDHRGFFSHSVRLEKVFSKVWGSRQRAPNTSRPVSGFFLHFLAFSRGRRAAEGRIARVCWTPLDSKLSFPGDRWMRSVWGYLVTGFSTADSAPRYAASAHICSVTPPRTD